MKHVCCGLVMILALVCIYTPARARPILYQGFLTNTRGEPVSGSFQMRFTLFDAASGGANRWGARAERRSSGHSDSPFTKASNVVGRAREDKRTSGCRHAAPADR
jgi:hypothetical protein